MLKSYLKIAWRNILKKPFYSTVNIIGLSAGIAFTMLIAAYIWSELQVNKQLKNADRQYIIQSKWKDPNQGLELTTVGPLAMELKRNYPNLVANYYRWDGIGSNVSKGDRSFREGLQIGDSTLLDMYGFKLLHGDARTALKDPFTLVITADRAKKYFGKSDVLGETLTIENFSGSKHDFKITGVLTDISKNSVTYVNDDNDNQFYVSTENLNFFSRGMPWQNPSIVSYVELKKGVTPADLDKPIAHLMKQNAPDFISANMMPYLVPLEKYYLSANNNLSKKMLYALSAIAFFILLMAVINFINLSVSRSTTRMREIGIRKVLGGMKKQLIVQFLVESILLVLLATLVAVFLYLLTRDLFSTILSRPIPSLLEFPAYFVLFPLLLAGIVGIIAGVYPAFVLSSLKSVESLKGKLVSVKRNVFMRKSLVAFQFGTATIVFTGAIVISQQVNLFFSRDLGFNKDYIVSALLPRNWSPEGVRNMQGIRNQFAVMPEVVNTTLSYEVPDGGSGGSTTIYRLGSDSSHAIAGSFLQTDENYASTYNIPMAAGVFFSAPGAFTDSSGIVINETQSKVLGWKSAAHAIGGQVKFVGFNFVFKIVGVTKDFHFGSMQNKIQPLVFAHVGLTNTFRVLSFKLKPGDIAGSLNALQKKWAMLMPGTPFEYKFMDDTLKRLYKSEIQLKQASYTATVLSIIIVLLGVLGLVALSVQKRTKEIGIRKVLGASLSSITTLFMKEFLSAILIAGIIACPVAWLLMNGWLNDYAYRVALSPTPFIVSVIGLGFITALLITLQTIKAGTDNPVKSLRTE
jgi:ABC-type antimicrobial peptide transport system permease subunit